MKNTDIFNDYDMVVSVSKRIINQELSHLTRMGTIRPEFVLTRSTDDDGNFQYTVLDSEDALKKDAAGNPIDDQGNPLEAIAGGILPQIEIAESGTNVTLVLNFRSGTAWFARGLKVHAYDMTGWKYGIVVTLDMKAVEKEAIGKNIKVPDLVEQQLYHFMDNMFTINHLFMDFESTDLLRFDPTHTDTGSESGDVGEQAFVLFMQFYLKHLVASGNPFVLGYSLTTTSGTTYPDDQKVPDELKPVGTTYSLYHDPDPAQSDLSNLNFVLATKGGHGAIPGTPGNFDTNWLSPGDQCDAKMIYSHSCLLEKFILKPFYETFSSQLFNGDATHPGINGNVSVNQGNAYDAGKALTPTGFSYTISNQGMPDDDDRYVNTYTVDIVNDAAAATATLNFKGAIYLYKKVSKEILPKVNAVATSTTNLAWSGSVTLSTTKNADNEPTVAITKAFKVDSSNQDSDMNDVAKATHWIATIFGKLVDLFTAFQDHDAATNFFNDLISVNVPGVGDITLAFSDMGDSISTVLILPAGQVFFFKNPAIDSDANLSLLLTYKSDNDAPANRALAATAQA